MGNLILSRPAEIKRPYYVSDLGVHLYSAEELCYYIYHNAVLIDESFGDERLLDFIHQLDQPRLEERILRVKEQGGLYDLLYAILQELRYYSSSELFNFRKQLESLSRASLAERTKAKGDSLFARGQYYGAIRAYNQVLDQDGRELADGEFVAGIWKNKAACFARTDHYAEALADLKNAYILTRDPGLAEKMYALNRLMGQDEVPEPLKEQISEETLEQFRSNWEKRWQLAAYQGKALEAGALEEEPEPARSQAFKELLKSWKDEYRRKQLS